MSAIWRICLISYWQFSCQQAWVLSLSTHRNLTNELRMISCEYFDDDVVSVQSYNKTHQHYNDVIMSAMASQITSLHIVYSTVHSGADQGKHQSSASLAFVWGIHRWPVNSQHKLPITRKMFPFDNVIMKAKIVFIIHEMHVIKARPLTKKP